MINVNFFISRLIFISVSLALVSGSLFENFEDRKPDKEEFSKWINFLLKKFSGRTISVTRSAVIISGNLNEEIITDIYRTSISAVALFTESCTVLDHSYASALKNMKYFYEKNIFRYQSKAGVFIIAENSQPLLRQAFDRLKSSIWWNYSGSFFLMKEDIEKPDCPSAFSYLWTAWQNGILSAVYFCKENTEGEPLSLRLFLYSYNPFSDRVPLKTGWKIVAIYSGRDGHPWTLFRLKIEGYGNSNGGEKGGFSDINSEEIFFDKISGDLNGYPVRVNLIEKSPTLLFLKSESESSGPEKYFGNDGWLAKAVWVGLNATLVEIIYEKDSNLGWTNEEGKHIGMKSDFATGRADVGLNRRFFGLSFGLAMTYPLEMSSCCFLTKSKDFEPLWKSLIKGFDTYTISLTFVAILGLNFVLEGLENHRSSWLKIIRLFITCDGVSRAPLKIPSRILFLGACGFLGMVATIVQGQVSALVTKPLHRGDVDDLDDLFESGYEAHSYYGFDTMITDPRVRARLVIDQNYTLEKCLEASIEDKPGVACLAECPEIWAKASRNRRLHIAKGKVFSRYLHYVAKIDWPIIDELNTFISRLFEAGLMQLWDKKSAGISVKKQNDVESSTLPKSEPRYINLNDLRVVFYLLFIGIIFATISLIIEIVYFQFKKKNESDRSNDRQILSIGV